jgi:hypothetical protein
VLFRNLVLIFGTCLPKDVSRYRWEVMKRIKKVILDKDLAKVGSALRRAAKQARKIAIQTNTPLVVWENGRVVKKKLSREKDR